jgi:H+-translocating NAD(P) transhydrogenase subunit alpha
VRIAIRRETVPGESRVAIVPDLVARLTRLGYEVAIEPDAGRAALFEDEDYAAAGAVVDGAAVVGADLVLSVQPVPTAELDAAAPGVTTLSFFPPADRDEVIARRDRGATTFAMELVPRISRAQPMDALSSQAMVTGYRGAVVAAGRLRQFFPLSMTAAGTVRPAEVLVLGAGVAGLQAIATARRLGAVVRGYDVRAAAAEEIASLGAVPVDLELPTLEGSGGYAREMSEERARMQLERLAPYVAAADALITTAAVPGRRAPVLVTSPMVAAMKPGSVVVDLAADSGGNVEGVVAGQAVMIGSVQLWGGRNVPSQMPNPASRLYAQNVWHVVELMTARSEPGGVLAPDFADEIVAGMCVTRAGEVVHGPTAERLAAEQPVAGLALEGGAA